jgi:chemotaxis methyl-accepting protein methylase
MAEVLVPDGYLLLGPIETVQGLSTEYETFGDVPGVFVMRRPSLLRVVAG